MFRREEAFVLKLVNVLDLLILMRPPFTHIESLTIVQQYVRAPLMQREFLSLCLSAVFDLLVFY